MLQELSSSATFRNADLFSINMFQIRRLFHNKTQFSIKTQERCNQKCDETGHRAAVCNSALSVPTRSASDHQYRWCSRTKTANMTQADTECCVTILKGTGDGWRAMFMIAQGSRGLSRQCLCAASDYQLFFSCYEIRLLAAPLLGETISKLRDGGAIEEVKGQSKLILSDRQASFMYLDLMVSS